VRNEKTYPDVGGGFVESHPRGPGIDWDDEYPYKGSEQALCVRRLERTNAIVDRSGRARR
jgi:hypothetical protein